jgi:hypothetical protein
MKALFVLSVEQLTCHLVSGFRETSRNPRSKQAESPKSGHQPLVMLITTLQPSRAGGPDLLELLMAFGL